MFKSVDVIDEVEELLSVLESVLRPGSPVVEDMCSHVLPESHQVTDNDKKQLTNGGKKFGGVLRHRELSFLLFHRLCQEESFFYHVFENYDKIIF